MTEIYTELKNPFIKNKNEMYDRLVFAMLNIAAVGTEVTPTASLSVVLPTRHNHHETDITSSGFVPVYTHELYKRRGFLARLGSDEFVHQPAKGEEASFFAVNAKIVLREILECNGLRLGDLYRAAFNVTPQQSHPFSSEAHVDLSYPNLNMIVYLNTTGGDTFLSDDKVDFSPKPDHTDIGKVPPTSALLEREHVRITPEKGKIILFDGATPHWNEAPTFDQERRAVLVYCFSLR